MTAATPTFQNYLCLHMDQIADVINPEAVSIERPLFLATHVPMTNMVVDRSPERLDQVSEEGLLQALRGAATQDLHTFVVIKGVPGTGKSHLIRWLKERFVAEQRGDNRDVVLLIERRNSSLRGTLDQLLNSGVFDRATTEQQLQRLRNASMTLSNEQLSEMLLNNIQVGALKGEFPDGRPVRERIKRNCQAFLLEILVREELKRPGGPIDRIATFASQGRTGLHADQLPRFEPDDLKFSLRLRQQIRQQSNKMVGDLTDDLTLNEGIQTEFVEFLNALIPFAIEKTTALSGEDLRSIFLDLRKQLRTEKRGFVLFIEDVTSFTGVDRALMDVLITQHTGEGNRDLSRLISVIGTTDVHFASTIPTNVHDRITYLVTLNAANNGATLLSSADSISDFSSRYLNALRATPEALEAWSNSGARLENLPIRCDECLFRDTCHPAFGAVTLSDGGVESSPVGLYPFNKTALSTMFNSVDRSRADLTPRTLLRSVLQYVLQSHADSIRTGGFPPAPERLGSDFAAPPLANPLQDATIERQAGVRAPSVRTLIRVWGDRTVTAAGAGSKRRVGSLQSDVFTAFGLPFIDGEASGVLSTAQVTKPIEYGGTLGSTAVIAPVVTPVDLPVIEQLEPLLKRTLTETEQLVQSINDWTQGQALQQYNVFASRVAEHFTDAIDWDDYGVTDAIVAERLKPGRIYFEGQAGASRAADNIVLSRSRELSNVLNALVILRSAADSAVPDGALGGAVSTISTWTRKITPDIVEYLRRLDGDTPQPMPLVRLAIRVNLAVAALRGAIDPASIADSNHLFLSLIQNGTPGKSSAPSDSEWLDEFSLIRARAPQQWANATPELWKRIPVKILADRLKQTLNLSRTQSQQGEGTVFLDAATAIDELALFAAQEWNFPPVEARAELSSAVWNPLIDASRFMTRFFHAAAEEAAQTANRQLACIRQLIGDDAPEKIIESIRETIEVLKQGQAFSSVLTGVSKLEERDLEMALRRLETVSTAQGALAAVASMAARPPIEEVIAIVQRLDEFAQYVDKELGSIAQALEQSGIDETSEHSEIEQTLAAYDQLLSALASQTSNGAGRSR